jgi:undecaprenyl diphosphate synthase
MLVENAREFGIKFLTIYTFSKENWKRNPIEVSNLMELLRSTVFKEIDDLIKNGVSLQVSGDLSGMPLPQRKAMEYAIERTSGQKDLVLNLALNYGGRQEILMATREIAQSVKNGTLSIENIDESYFSSCLYTGSLPDPELLIRTGGEYRLSNFLLWQTSYTELFITEKYWPDFDKDELFKAIKSYLSRERRFDPERKTLMLPELLRIGPLAVRSWGLMCAIAFAVGMFLAYKRAPRFNIK